MLRFLKFMRNVFCYCGLSKEDYRAIKRVAYVENFRVWKYLNLMMTVVSLVCVFVAQAAYGMAAATWVRMGIFVYSLFTTLTFFHLYREDSLLAQFHIYANMTVLLLLGMWLGIRDITNPAVTFEVLLVLLPMFMIDKPYFMAGVLSLASAVYLCHIVPMKPDVVVLRSDVVNTVIYCLLGIIINTFYNYIRIHEFVLNRKNQEHILEQEEAYRSQEQMSAAMTRMCEGVTELMGDMIESRDSDSGNHVARVRGFTNILAKQVMCDWPEYGLTNHKVNLITFTSAMHDIGKVQIPDAILLKPGRLTPEEFEVMKSHCEKGCDILRKMDTRWDGEYLETAMEICRSHHEKWDGGGYPDGLRGDEIPISAQIVSIADIFDALTSKRVYKDACSCVQAYDMIMAGECGAFSDKLKACLTACYPKFKAHAENPEALELEVPEFEVSASTEGIVVGLHDRDRSKEEKQKLERELEVVKSISEEFLYIGYVDESTNEVHRFSAEPQIAALLDSMGNLRSNLRFDRLLNSLVYRPDYDRFREVTERESALREIRRSGKIVVNFRTETTGGRIRRCRMKITPDPNNSNCFIVGIMYRD